MISASVDICIIMMILTFPALYPQCFLDMLPKGYTSLSIFSEIIRFQLYQVLPGERELHKPFSKSKINSTPGSNTHSGAERKESSTSPTTLPHQQQEFQRDGHPV